MSNLSHRRWSQEGEQEASPSEGLVLGAALIERTARAIEAEVRRMAYLYQIKEMFAPSDDSLGFSHGLDESSVRASALGCAGAPESRPGSQQDS